MVASEFAKVLDDDITLEGTRKPAKENSGSAGTIAACNAKQAAAAPAPKSPKKLANAPLQAQGIPKQGASVAPRDCAEAVQVEKRLDAAAPPSSGNTSEVDQMYQDLHTKISGRSFNSQVAQVLNSVVNVVTEKSFLNVAHVEKGGAVTKGTAIAGDADAEIVFFVKGLPTGDHAKWLRPLLKSVEAVLTHHFTSNPGQLAVSDITTTQET